MLDEVDDFETSGLSERQKTVLRFTDAVISNPHGLSDDVKRAMLSFFTPAEIVELTLAVSQFRVFSSLVISLGLEPDSMPTWVL